MSRPRRRRGRRLGRVAIESGLMALVALVLSPVAVALAVVASVRRGLSDPRLRRRVEREWLARGKRMLLVYADTPAWKRYVENDLLPRIGARAVAVKWSERRRWLRGRSLEACVFRRWAPGYSSWRPRRRRSRQYTPLAIVFVGRASPVVVPFWPALRDLQRGDQGPLRRAESCVLAALDEAAGRPAAAR